METFSRTVHAIAWRMTYDRHLAADLTQEVFVHLYQNLRRYDPERPFRPWFMKLATNAAINAAKKRRRREVSLDGMGRAGEGDRGGFDPEDGAACAPPEGAADAEVRGALHEAIRELTPTYRAVVALHYLEGMGVAEVAEALDIPVGTVKIRLYRARAVLREKLARWEKPS